MTARARGYLHADTPFEVELERLHLLEARYDEVTRARLGTVGPLQGLACLEVGAGAGSVARMLARMVGVDGVVVALDLDPRFLGDLDLPNLTVRRHDICTDDLEQACYDLVHCRALLLHLPDPVTALRQMVAALQPGGLLLVEDADYRSFEALPGHPRSEAFNRLFRAWFDGDTCGKWFDRTFAGKLPDLLAELGLVERGQEALRFVRTGSSPEAEVHALGVEALRAGALSRRSVDEAEIDGYVAALRDPDFRFVDSLNVAAWGRRPMPGYFG